MLMVILLFSSIGLAQETIRPLQIGDTIPEVLWRSTFTLVDGDGERSMTLDDHRGKLILLDFLSTGCPGCIAALPKIGEIAASYNGEIVVLPITVEKRERVATFFNINDHVQSAGIPFLVEGRSLSGYFPHRYISHLVWIGRDGVVRASTGTSQLTEATVAEFASGKVLDWPVKTEHTPFFGRALANIPLVKGSLPANRRVLDSFVWLSGAVEGAGRIDNDRDGLPEGYRWISFRNRSAVDLLRIALQLRGKDSLDWGNIDLLPYAIWDRGELTLDEWSSRHAICYERPVRIDTADDLWKAQMCRDICSYLGLALSEANSSGRRIVTVTKIPKL